MGKIIRLGLILLALTAITGLLLGVVYGITKEPIRKTQERQKMEALAATLPGAQNFKTLPVSGGSGVILEINEGSADGSVLGYNFTVAPKGYAGLIELVVGISTDGTIQGIQILKHAETPGLGAKAAEPAFSGQFKGKKADKLEVVKVPPSAPGQIQAISGATITSAAVTSGVNEALSYFKAHLSGGQTQ
ncbi:MAG: RnfABCDGE type electron transport complex subunit G [Synergistaceae bacterium]|jgi:electron transport complex, RnfABCDGE type, G subunit|nr:RnfABCDGE type electron transport complex subunit G [Synergistaceae bacterium]MBP9958343.1 RnfABCDGE type electron transport complex subunit G [Synergistaceae bacterium]